ncbi:MAG: ketoacyl-ACP synthase III [Bryobacteraceae bacterium]|jgi:3-oxoacyl-[acyl-carrier-protein] synthase-3
MQAAIKAIEYYLPEQILSSAQLAAEFPEWSPEKIEAKTGITQRHIAAEGECSSDLACAAAGRLFASGACGPADIDYLLLCTQSPDYFLPTTACVLQDRLGLPTSAGALDFNLGCSGFVYGLGVAQGLIATGQAANVLLITAETYSKFIHPRDKSVRTIFGDAAAATLVSAVDAAEPCLGPFVFGTDGSGAKNLIVPTGGMRRARTAESAATVEDKDGNWRSEDNLYMNGAEIFNFTLRAVPECVERLLAKAARRMEDVDLFVFHQANRFMLDHLRRKLKIPAERFPVAMEHCGNTVSSTIPIALKIARERGQLQAGRLVMAVGFGVGYSWGAGFIRWRG